MSIKVYTVTLDDDAGVNTQAFWHEEDADIYHALLIGELWWRHRETIPTALDPYEVYEDLSCSARYFDWVRIEAIEPCSQINTYISGKPLSDPARIIHTLSRCTPYSWPADDGWSEDQGGDAITVMNHLIVAARAITGLPELPESEIGEQEGGT